jgi:hypothetical protein
LTQVVPQQRCIEEQVGMHMPGGPPSMRGGIGPLSGSMPPQTPLTQRCPMAHMIPQPPQLVGSLSGKTQLAVPSPRPQHWSNPVHIGSQALPSGSSRPPAQLISRTLAPITAKKADFMTSPLPASKR